MNKIAAITVFFPGVEKYLRKFLESLNNQTEKNFDLIVINDKYGNLEKIQKRFPCLSIIDVPYSSTISKNKEFGIRYAKNAGYEFLVFCDSDDYFSHNRVKKSVDFLKSGYDIVCNDISLFEKESIYKNKYFSNRLENKTNIDLSFLEDKNIMGFTNTSISLNNLDIPEFLPTLIASDWFFFTNLMRNGASAIFTNEMISYYRQHKNNTIGIGNLNLSVYRSTVDIKLQHYRIFEHLYPCLGKLISSPKLKNPDEHLQLLLDNRINNPFWLEEVRVDS